MGADGFSNIIDRWRHTTFPVAPGLALLYQGTGTTSPHAAFSPFVKRAGQWKISQTTPA
jgi:hypothetical protein